MNYHRLAFTNIVQDFQEYFGSRMTYSLQEKIREVGGFTNNEINFLQDMDHFFMASFGDNEYPYIQHRGGPPGFVKVLDSKTLGLIDFSGNKQYISIGNITSNPNVALIFLSYPHRARLKVYAKAKLLSLTDHPELIEKLKIENYKYRSERIMLFDVQAFDWNCPQHITQRFTVDEIEIAMEDNKKYVQQLELKINQLEEQLSGYRKN